MRPCRFYMMIVFVCFFSLCASSQEKVSTPLLKVSGEVMKPLTLNADDLAKMKRINVSMKDRQGKDHDYAGAAVQEILNMAGVTMGSQLRGQNLTKYLLVKCADGYEVVFTLPELDSSFTDRTIILAYESDGKPLPAGIGPFRLVVPGEKKPARSGFQVTEFIIRFAKE